MKKIVWGIIGCGNVTEVKSGPAFNLVPNSILHAVMRRDGAKAEDYAKRHHVPKWYSDADQLINDPEINGIYVATPPDSHEDYTLKAFKAGKSVYVEKPMALNSSEAIRMLEASKKYSCKLSVAHYRRAQPKFLEIKRLIDKQTIGNIVSVDLKLSLAPTPGIENTWRVNPDISGGGNFHDLAPHQLDLMLFFFGEPVHVEGKSSNIAGLYKADDFVSTDITFGNNIKFKGVWDFTGHPNKDEDICVITGTKGQISFAVFTDPCEITINGKTEPLTFNFLPHVQQPMIEQVVNYFLGDGPNPCSAEDAVIVMQMLDKITGKIS
jgi:predicted dehydrogenase